MVLPFRVPHFTIDGSTLTYFPTKADFIIADFDGDGKITEADAELWNDTFAFENRLMELVDLAHPDYDPEDTFPFIWEEEWWKDDSVRIWATIENTEVTLSWEKDTWLLALELPKAMIDLQMTLLFIGMNQQRFREVAVNSVQTIRPDNVLKQAAKWFTSSSLYKGLVSRLEYLYRTYIRL